MAWAKEENNMSIWNFLNEMENLQLQLNSFAKENSWHGMPRSAFLPGLSSRHFPMMNVSADENNVVVEALAPGLDVENIKVSALKDQLTISGEKKNLETKDEKYHRSERSTGKFVRTIELPTAINPDAVEASYTNGILKITMPKAEEAKPRQISIKVA